MVHFELISFQKFVTLAERTAEFEWKSEDTILWENNTGNSFRVHGLFQKERRHVLEETSTTKNIL